MDRNNLKYGITKTATGYDAEPIQEGMQYDMYIATSNWTTAGCGYNIVNENLEDLIQAKRWIYHAFYHWGCVEHYVYMSVTLIRGRKEIIFTFEDSDELLSEFVRIMMLIANTCETMDDAKQLLNKNHINFRDMVEWKDKISKTTGKQTPASSLCFIDSDNRIKSDDDLPF